MRGESMISWRRSRFGRGPRGGLCLGVLAAVFTVGVSIAQAAVTESVEFTAKVARADKNKRFGGLTLRTVLSVRDDTGAKPPPLTNTTLRFPKGAVVNAKLFKKCKRAELERQGPSACPAASKVGVGTAVGDARPIIGDVKAKVTLYNGDPVNGNPTILIYAVPEISSPLTVQGELKRQRSGPYGYVLDVDVPTIPTVPGQPNASVVFFDTRTLDKTVKRRGRKIHYIEGPIVCDGTFFLLDGTFSYEGGITHTVYERFTVRGGPRCP
jgi:hypothetical protein